MDHYSRSSEYEDIPSSGASQGAAPRRKKKGNLWFAGGIVTGIVGTLVLSGVVMASSGGSFSGSFLPGGKSATLDNATLEKLSVLEQYIDAYYLDADTLTAEQKREGLYKGLFSALGDPYSEYYTAEEMEQIQEDMGGFYYGIGAYIGTDEVTGAPMITGVIKNSPAEAAQLRDGDIIYQVDGEEVTALSLDDVVARIRGPEGTKVHLTLYRDGEQVEIDITRAKVDSPTVDSRILGEEEGDTALPESAKGLTLGYLQIAEFDTVTTGQFKEEMADLQAKGIQGLVLDLRNNPGGSVSTVTEIAQEFLPEGLVFYIEDRQGKRTEYKCTGTDFSLPLVVLVNGNSASASEILAGGIQDAGVGKLVGTQTFGKGIVQNLVPLSDGTGFKMTTAGYFTRGGHDIHKVGITPDEVVEFDSDAYREDGTDNQLYRAEEILAEQIMQGKDN